MTIPTRTASPRWFALGVTLATAVAVPVLQGCGQGTGESHASTRQSVAACTSYQGAYGGTPWTVPGQIEAENYDLCGQNWAYYDTTPGNAGGAYRQDDVDIEGTGDTGGGYDVGWIAPGEWLNFTSNVTTSGSYQVQLRVAAVAAQTMHLEVDGVDVTGSIAIPSTGGWQSWTTVTSPKFALTVGAHIVAAAFDSGNHNLNWMSFRLAGSGGGGSGGGSGSCNSASSSGGCASYGACNGTPWTVPGQIEAEDYDLCGQNTGYYDTTPGNTGGAYRNDDVDIEATGDSGGGYDVGWIAAGEWLNYSANVTSSGAYQVQVRVAAEAAQTMHIAVDGADVTGSISIPSTGGWQSWTTVTSPTFSLTAGSHVLAAGFDTGGHNLNWLNFQQVSSGGNGGGGGSPPLGQILSSSMFDTMFPNRNPFYTYDGLIAATANFSSFANEGTTDDQKRDVAAFLANVAHETGGLYYIDEIQTAPYCDDTVSGCPCAAGVEYYGRGPIQISWNANYCAASQFIFGNPDTLRTNPDLVSTDASVSWATGLWFWTQTTCESDIVNDQSFGETIQTVNGPIECNGGNPTEVQDRVNYYLRFCQLLGVSPGSGALSC